MIGICERCNDGYSWIDGMRWGVVFMWLEFHIVIVCFIQVCVGSFVLSTCSSLWCNSLTFTQFCYRLCFARVRPHEYVYNFFVVVFASVWLCVKNGVHTTLEKELLNKDPFFFLCEAGSCWISNWMKETKKKCSFDALLSI